MPLPIPSTPTTSPAANALPGIVGTALKTAWDWKHAMVTAGLVLSVLGPIAKQYWPDAAPIIDAAQKVAESPAAPPESKVQPTAYETDLRTAWEMELATDAYRKRLIFLYRGVARNAAPAKTPAELKSAFTAEEKRLDMIGRLPFVRAIAAKEWSARFPVTKPLLADADRAAIVEFLTQTAAILDKL
jgi:hypothetical protein